MGRLLDSLKKKNFNVGKTSTYRERKTKEQVALILSNLLVKTPNDKKLALMQEFLTPETRLQMTSTNYNTYVKSILTKDDATIRRYLTDKKHFGKSCEELLPLMEDRLYGWTDSIYTKSHIGPDASAEDKMVALFKSATFSNRTNFMWDLVDPKQIPVLERQLLTGSLEHPKKFARRLMEPDTLIKGDDALTRAYTNAVSKVNGLEAVKDMDVMKDLLADRDMGSVENTEAEGPVLGKGM